MWSLVPQPGIEPRPPTLGGTVSQTPDHWGSPSQSVFSVSAWPHASPAPREAAPGTRASVTAHVGGKSEKEGTRVAPLVAQLVKNPPAVRETWIRPLGWEDPLEKGKAPHSSVLAWRIPWPAQLQRAGHDWATFTSIADSLYCNLKLTQHRASATPR